MERCGAEHDGFFGYMARRGQRHVLDSRVQGNYTWRTTADSSIKDDNGYQMPFIGDLNRDSVGSHEIVSPVLYGRAGQLHAEKVWRELIKAGFKVNSSCGTHITMGMNHNTRFNRMSDEKKTEIGMRIAQIYSHFQPVFDALSSNVRNGQFHYCSTPRLDRPFNNRTSAVNLTAWALYGRVEFRQFGYTTDIRNFRGWLKICDSILSCAFNENHVSYGLNLRGLNPVPKTWESMANFLNIGTAQTAWGAKRISEMILKFRDGRSNRLDVMKLFADDEVVDFPEEDLWSISDAEEMEIAAGFEGLDSLFQGPDLSEEGGL